MSVLGYLLGILSIVYRMIYQYLLDEPLYKESYATVWLSKKKQWFQS